MSTLPLKNLNKSHLTGHVSMIGTDTNPDGFGLTEVSKQGNYRGHAYLKQHELTFCRGNRRANLCGELSAQAVGKAEKHHCGIAAEDLKFKDDRDLSSKLARVSRQYVYSKLLRMLERRCLRHGVEFVKVKPQYTSKIGLYKYCHQYGLDVHNGAALVIVRRSYNLKEAVPKLLQDKLVPKKKLTAFKKMNAWGQWSEISKQVNKLSADVLNGIWKDLMMKYYGSDFEADEYASLWWSRIPHFYMDFYVYKYATAIAASNQLVNGMVNGGISY